MTESGSTSKLRIVFGCLLLALGVALFAIRLQHEGTYAMPRGTNLIGGLGALLLGAGTLVFYGLGHGLSVGLGIPQLVVGAGAVAAPAPVAAH